MNLRTSSEQHHTAVRSTTSTAPSLNNLVATCTHAFIVTRKQRNCSASEKMRGFPHDLTIPQFTKPHSVPNSPRVYMACVNRMAILQYSSNANDNHCDTCGGLPPPCALLLYLCLGRLPRIGFLDMVGPWVHVDLCERAYVCVPWLIMADVIGCHRADELAAAAPLPRDP